MKKTGAIIKWQKVRPDRCIGLLQDPDDLAFYGFSTFDVAPDAWGNRDVSEGETVQFEVGPGRHDKKGKFVKTAVKVTRIPVEVSE